MEQIEIILPKQKCLEYALSLRVGVDHMEEKKIWGIHTLNDRLFLDKNIIAIGWKAMGDLSVIDQSRDAYKDKYSIVFPEAKIGTVRINGGQLYRFVTEAQIGDYIIFPSKFNREVNIGKIEGEYFYNESAAEYVQQRKVKWIKNLPRTAFSQGALSEIGSALTFFSVKNYSDEFLFALDKNFKAKEVVADEDDTLAKTAEDIIESTKDFIIKELSKHFKGYDLEYFIADLLEAMGYHTISSPRGGDRGIDIKAYKDELPPRIVVQVKSQDSDISEAMLQSLKGAMYPGDYGLFVTLSNYTKNALRFLESNPMIRGISGGELSELILKYYDKLNDKHRKTIPLKMVYIPVVEK